MSKILFLNLPSVGHLNTLLTIALQMKETGHEVSFLVPGFANFDFKIQILQIAAQIPKLIEKAGLEVKTIPPSLLSAILVPFLPLASGYTELMLALGLASIGIDFYTTNIIKHIEKVRPDILVTDFAFFASSIAAEATNIPYVTIYHSGLPFSGKIIPPFGSGLPINEDAHILGKQFARREKFILGRLDQEINKTRRKFGLSDLEPNFLSKPYSKWLNLLTSAEIIEAPRDLTNNTFFIGPCFTKQHPNSDSFPFDKLEKNKYKIYVSLGTVFNNKPNVFRKIMKALDSNDYQVIMSAGGAYKTLRNGKVPSNVMLFPSVPQIELLPKVDLVIGHGGNNSTNETLAAGKPLIIIPVGGEQGDNASRVEYLGVGARLNIKTFNEEELKTKVNNIKTNLEIQNNLAKIKQELEKTDGAKTASFLIEWLVKNKKPLIRPDNFPLTVTKSNYSLLA